MTICKGLRRVADCFLPMSADTMCMWWRGWRGSLTVTSRVRRDGGGDGDCQPSGRVGCGRGMKISPSLCAPLVRPRPGPLLVVLQALPDNLRPLAGVEQRAGPPPWRDRVRRGMIYNAGRERAEMASRTTRVIWRLGQIKRRKSPAAAARVRPVCVSPSLLPRR